MNSVTPMIKQYLEAKGKHPDAILFYRMGDFYEMFFEDAKIASEILDIALTSRDKSREDSVPLCGVPYHAASGYIQKLVDRGFKVAICEQVEDVSQAKGLVKREVIRIVTPGMVVEDELLQPKANNFLMSVALGEERFGLAVLDASTGDFLASEVSTVQSLRDEILRVGPREILLPEPAKAQSPVKSLMKACPAAVYSWMPAEVFEPGRSRERLAALGLSLPEGKEQALRAVGAVLFYVQETQKAVPAYLSRLEFYSVQDYLVLDETTRRNLELLEQKSRIEAADRMKSTFIATMSHELRTPLNSIIALSRVLITQAKKRLTPDEAGYLSIVERNGSRLLALVNDILDLSRIESGKVDLTVWPFSPAQMIETLCKSLEPLAREKGLKIIQEIPRDLPDLHSDERYVHRILQNILMNAIKFTDKGMISLTARSEGGSLLVKVCDTGIGIRSEELQRIFDEFVRGDASASSPYEGSGLGLAIAAKSARLLGGEIRVESRPDEGSEFTLILPLRIQENPEDTAEEESALPQKSAGERE